MKNQINFLIDIQCDEKTLNRVTKNKLPQKLCNFLFMKERNNVFRNFDNSYTHYFVKQKSYDCKYKFKFSFTVMLNSLSLFLFYFSLLHQYINFYFILTCD